MLDYLTNRKQTTKIGLVFNSWYNISTGVPKGSVLAYLLFCLFINDLLFSITKSEVCNFADSNALYSCSKNLKNVFPNLKWDLKISVAMFQNQFAKR